MKRRDFFKITLSGTAALPFGGCERAGPADPPPVDEIEDLAHAIFHISGIPADPFTIGNHHAGIDTLLRLMGQEGLKFYRTASGGRERGRNGLIAADDVVLIKVNAQWKYRGCTNSDVVRGLVQRILEHPDGFDGEVVIFENGQGSGSLDCRNSPAYDGDTEVHANAQDERHSFRWLVDDLFRDPRVSALLLDPVRTHFIDGHDHATDGYRILEDVSYPCFTTAGGRRVELREGIWTGSSFRQNLKLLNVPVLKNHDYGGSEFTGVLKHVYGILTMSDGRKDERHYDRLGQTCGTMMSLVRTPALNILDAIWVSHRSRAGYPASDTFRADTLLASQDPVALDYWAAKYVLYPIDRNERHHPDSPAIDAWLTAARDAIAARGGFDRIDQGVFTRFPTKTETEMVLHEMAAGATK